MISASLLNQYSFCPRGIYLSQVLKIKTEPTKEQIKGLLGHGIRKELSLRQAKLLKKLKHLSDLELLLLEEFEQILEDVPSIYRNMLSGISYEKFIPEIKQQVLNEIKLIEKNLGAMVEELGLDKALERVTPWRVEYSIQSHRLQLSGRIDKVMKDKGYIPVEIKTGNPSEGVWQGDRLQTCAYALLLEEKFKLKEPILFGYVEYTQIQERHPVMNTEKLRREVINTRDSIKEILQGRIPEICSHGSGKKCDTCGYKERCYEL